MCSRIQKRALVFDDDQAIRQLFQVMLERCGYEVHCFEDPSDYCSPDNGLCPLAPHMCCANVIISDLYMPRVDGILFMQTITAKCCQVPARAMLSGSWTPDALEMARQFGCQTFSKPMNITVILNWLHDLETHYTPTVSVSPSFPVRCGNRHCSGG